MIRKLKKIFWIFIMATIFFVGNIGGIGAEEIVERDIVEIEIGSSPIQIDANQSNIWYETSWLTTEFAMDCKAKSYENKEIYLNGHLITEEKPTKLKIDKMNTKTGIEVKIVDTDTRKMSFNYIRTVPESLGIEAVGKPEQDGLYYFTINGYLLKMDGNGDFRFFAHKAGSSNFKPNIINGKIYYSYVQQVNIAEGFNAGELKAKNVVMNSLYEEIDSIEFLMTDKGMPANYNVENHEFLMLDEGHYIVTGYVIKNVTNIPKHVLGGSNLESKVVAAVIQEIKDGKLIFQWDSTEHPEFYEMSTDGNDFLNKYTPYADYVHINSVEIDPKDNNFIISLRNTSTIVKISRKSGDIIWILGGKGDQFGLTDEQKVSAQHDARISSRGTITVFDNGLVLPEGITNPFVDEYKTRVVEYKLDEKNKKLLSFKEYVTKDTCSPIMGSAKLLDESKDLFLVGWGGRRAGTPLFSEVDYKNGEVVFSVWCKSTSIIDGVTYRVYKSNK